MASDLFIISGEQSNEMSVWTRLFECTSCWVRPESFPLPSQPTQSDESVIHETGTVSSSTRHRTSRWRISVRSHIFPSSLATRFSSFLRRNRHLPDIDPAPPSLPQIRCVVHSVTNFPANFTAFVPAHSLSLHVTPAILSRDHSIHILHKIDSFSLLHILHLFLDSTFLSVSSLPFSTPWILSPPPTASTFLCSLFLRNDTHKPFPALFSTSPRGCYLLLPRDRGVSSQWLEATLAVSLQNDRYVVVTDGDVASQAFHRLRHNESLSEAFHPPSFFPPLKRDVTLFSPRGEAYLRGMRETVGKREPFHSRSHRRNLGGKNSSGKRRRKKGGKPVAHVW